MHVSGAVIVGARTVFSTVVFGQADETDDEGGPVFDGEGAERAFVLAEFESAGLAC